MHGIEPAYFCDRCREPSDTPIDAAPVFRRVQLVVEVLFSGRSLVPSTAVKDALTELERAVRIAGGLVNLQSATSVVGRHAAPAPTRMAKATLDRAQ